MPIKAGTDDRHTFRITGSIGARSFDTEINGTLADAKAKASQFEERQPGDGIFRRGAARIEQWTGTGYEQVDRYRR